MTTREGKALLTECLQTLGCTTDIDDLILYKYGNAKDVEKYQQDTIRTDTVFPKTSSAQYVVKCFIHIGVYAAWKREICAGPGKCDIYKKDLVAMTQKSESYCETLLDTGKTIYWFKGKEGIEQFIKKNLLNSQ